MNLIHRIFKKKPLSTCSVEKMYEVSGRNNKIIVSGVETTKVIPGLDISISGSDNTIYIDDADNFKNVHINIINSNNNTIKFGVKYGTLKSLNNITIIIRDCTESCVEIGDRTLIYGAIIRMGRESNAGIIIGNDCLFSDSINIWPADGHPVFSAVSNQQINKVTSPIIIGDKVWVGQGVRITKNAKIPDGCIIAGGAVVCKAITKQNCVIAGNPGKIVKEDVYWKHY